MNQLAVQGNNLPENIEQIAHEVLIGRERLTAIRAAIRAAKKNKATWQEMQREGCEYGERILEYELVLKEAFAALPKATKGSGGNRYKPAVDRENDSGVDFSKSKAQSITDLGFSQKEAERIQQLTPEAVQEVIETARQTNDIPTRSAAIKIATRKKKRADIKERLESIEAREVKAVEGVYDVIVIDPPWTMQKIERDVRPNQSEFDYPTMDEDELAELTIPTADDCHIWLWTTHKHMPMAFRLLNTWDLKYVCTFVWHKPGGFQPYGLPQYNCEFALYARKGTPEFIDTKAFPTCFEAPRGSHSEKPEVFYDIVRRVTGGRRLDMFNRRKIDGFDGWGKEAAT